LFLLLLLSVQKEKDKKTRALIIFLSRREANDAIDLQFKWAAATARTHAASGEKKTQNGSRNVASIFKQRAREISKNPKFENNNPQNNNFFEFLALKMIIVFCQSALGT
jgi:hypothetical protein